VQTFLRSRARVILSSAAISYSMDVITQLVRDDFKLVG
jgi:hypothetical protein